LTHDVVSYVENFDCLKILTLERQGHAHTAADAKCGQAFLGIAALHFMQQGDQNTAA
jgi:hypothetical protein